MAQYDIILGRRGDSVTGTVRSTSFTIATDLGNVKVPTSQINQVSFRTGAKERPHEITLTNRDILRGRIQEEVVRFQRLGDNATVDVPTKGILMVLFAWAAGSGTRVTSHFE